MRINARSPQEVPAAQRLAALRLLLDPSVDPGTVTQMAHKDRYFARAETWDRLYSRYVTITVGEKR